METLFSDDRGDPALEKILAYGSSEIDLVLSWTIHRQGSFLSQGSPLSSEKSVSI